MTAPAKAYSNAGRAVVVCGGRDFYDRDMLFAAMDAFHALEPIGLVIEGGQRTKDETFDTIIGGADYWAMQWAMERGVSWITVEARWRIYGNSAGPKRNQRMIEMKPTLVIAFPGGRGTDDMVRRAERAGIPVTLPKEVG